MALLLSLVTALSSAAHESLPATLTVLEESPGHFEGQLRVPAREGAAPALKPAFEPGCTMTGGGREVPERGAQVRRFELVCPELRHGRVSIDGLAGSSLEVLVRLRFADGTSLTQLLRGSQPWVEVRGPAARWEYLRLGVEHILTGFDHLLFVLGLLLLVRKVGPLVKTVTAFTLAHSLTLALAVLGVVRIPVAPVEATIALSIVFLARELVRRDHGVTGLATRAPWLVAFSFGLLHGFGFAGALAGAGIPQGEIPIALLLFNVGVELGQLAFVAACLLAAAALNRLSKSWPAWALHLPPYAIGTLSAFWFLQRVSVIF